MQNPQRLLALALAASFVAITLPAAGALASTTTAPTSTDLVTVTLVIDATDYPHAPHDEPKVCDVEVPEGSDGKWLLTQATLDGCIAGWTGTYDPLWGTFVDSIDGRRAVCDTPAWLVHCSYWHLTVNDVDSTTGVDDWSAEDEDVYGFTYTRLYGVCALP